MSELYDPKFTRNKFGNYDKSKSFISVVGGTDSYFLEDEFNEMQRMQNEARAELFRAKYHSGIFKKNDLAGNIMCADTILRPNFFAFKDMTTLVNGYLLEVSGNLGFLDASKIIKDSSVNNVFIPVPPTEGYREDLIYVEMWFSELNYKNDIWINGNVNNYQGMTSNNMFDNRINGETCRRVQLQWAIRIAPGVDTKGIGFDESLLADNVPAIGGYTANSNYGFWNATKGLDGNLKSADKGLWVAGKGIPGEMNTVDGYSYAIPLFKIRRRNSSPYADYNRNGGITFDPLQTKVSDRPDGKFSNVVYEDDIVDLRNLVKVDTGDLKRILERNFSKLMTGQLTGLSKPRMMTAYFGLNPIIPQADTKLYLNCNKNMGYNNITPISGVPYSYVPGIEQEAVRFDGANDGMKYDLSFPLDKVCIQMITKFDGFDDKDIWSIRNDEKEVLSCAIRDGKFVIEDATHPGLISIDIYDSETPNMKEFVHIGVSWSKITKLLYLVLNGNIVATVDITNLMKAGQLKYFVLGWSDKSLGSRGTIFDEIEVAARVTTSFSQLPIDFVQKDAKLINDIQKGRRSYTLVSSATSLTTHLTTKSDSAGKATFNIAAPIGSKFTDKIPTIYFDNEAVSVDMPFWSGYNTDSLMCIITGLGGQVTYNFVVCYEVRFESGQGFNELPQKMHKATGEKSALPFIPVRADKIFEEHFIDRSFQVGSNVGNTLDRLRAYNTKVTDKMGFGCAIQCYIKSNGTSVIYIPRNIYTQEIISIYNVNVQNDPYRQNLIMDITYDETTFVVTLNQAIETGLILEVTAATVLPVITYNYIAGGIDSLAKVEKVVINGDGITKNFVYRSESKILSTLSGIVGGEPKYIAFIDGDLTVIDATLIDSFISFNFATVPSNKSNIVIYIVSEYEPARSERFRAWYEILEYQGSDTIDYVSSFDKAEVICHLDSIFVTTDGINQPIETRLNKNIINTAYLPIVGPIDSYLVPTKIAGDSTNLKARIDYAEMNANDFNDPIAILNNLCLNLRLQKNGRGYFGFATIDNKSWFSTTKLPLQVPHLCVLPMIVKDVDENLKLVVLTTYSEDDTIRISGNRNETAIDVFDLNENYLVK